MIDTDVCECSESLTSTQFERLLRHLHPDRERAGEKYEDLRSRLTKYFEWNHVLPAEDWVDETLDRVARRLEEMEIHDVASFSLGVAQHVRQEAFRKSARVVSISAAPEEEKLPTSSHAEELIHEDMELERQRCCLQECIRQLPGEDRTLFLAYYRPEGKATEARHRLARSLGLTMNALRVRVNRLRARIEKLTTENAASPASKSHARQRQIVPRGACI
jgi:DNA-directed RNA polymerase specialized sigma24 family protein